jgi:predicted DNA-binding transcriptional regulator AlpA
MSKTLQQALRFNANITIQIDDASQLSDFLKAIVLEALPKPVSEPVSESEILLRSREAAKLLDISERALWGFAKSGRIMKPICIGKSVRWNARELRRWAACGPSNE